MPVAVLVDAGPLVAAIDADDDYHRECLETLKTIRDPLVTVWPAFTEAMYFLRSWWEGQNALLEMVETEVVRFAALDVTDVPRIKALMRQYRDLPMDLADAALVRVAEREKLSRIFTLDRRHFRVYRASGGGRFSILPS